MLDRLERDLQRARELEGRAEARVGRLRREGARAVAREWSGPGDTPPGPEALEWLGLPRELSVWFERSDADFAFEPAVRDATPVAESPEHSLKHVRLQLPAAPREVAVGLKVLRALLVGLTVSVGALVFSLPPQWNCSTTTWAYLSHG